MTTETSTSTPYALRRKLKALLWVAMGGMTISVILYSEVPLLRQVKERAYLGTIPFLIIPHILAGIAALLIGPLQFSSRIRRDNPKFHRALGRVYVCSVFIAAPLAIILSNHRHDPRAIHFVVANTVQAGTWIIATGLLFWRPAIGTFTSIASGWSVPMLSPSPLLVPVSCSQSQHGIVTARQDLL
ncbi:DUF2306 domain-containing protein [Tunturiibacter gelidiferens]